MNAEHLKLVLQRLEHDDDEFGVQRSLVKLQSALQNVVNQPQDGPTQEAFSKALENSKKAVMSMTSSYSPALFADIEKVGGKPFFSNTMIDRISSQLSINAITPAVLLNDLNQIISERSAYIQHITGTIAGLEAFGIDDSSVGEAEAEIGFRIPRQLFENQLDGLIVELRAIRLILLAFSENTLGSPEPVEVRSISTSDPIFFFNLSVETVIAIGGAITWCLATWKQLEDIRKVRAETKKLGIHSDDETKAFFDDKIAQRIDDAVADKVTELTASQSSDAGRGQEIRNALSIALKSLLGRIERGMTVEIRYLPPPETDDDNEDGETDPLKAARERLDEIAEQLFFPEANASPLVQLPKIQDETKANSRTKTVK